MKQLIIMLLLILSFNFASMAEFDNRGTSAMVFSKMIVDARSASLGGAGTAFIRDVSSSYNNPAGLAFIKNGQALFTSTDWVMDIKLNSIAGAYNVENVGVFGVNFTYLSMGDMNVTTFENTKGDGAVKFSCHDLAIGVLFSRALTDRFSFGFQGKLLQEKIYNSYATTFAFDVGGIYTTPYEKLSLGLAVRNLGSKARMTGPDIKGKTQHSNGAPSAPDDVPYSLETKDWNIPFTFKIGLAYDVIEAERFKVTALADFIDENDKESRFVFGSEFNFINVAFLRVGYNDSYEDSNGMNFGGGFYYNVKQSPYSITFDYAYTDLGYLSDAHRFTFRLNF